MTGNPCDLSRERKAWRSRSPSTKMAARSPAAGDWRRIGRGGGVSFSVVGSMITHYVICMFYKIFHSEPVLPRRWKTIHLWIAQVFISSIIAAERDSFCTNITRVRLKKMLRTKFDEFVSLSSNQHWFPVEAIKTDLLSGIDQYIAQELENIKSALAGDSEQVTDIDGLALLAAINDDREFADFIRKTRL